MAVSRLLLEEWRADAEGIDYKGIKSNLAPITGYPIKECTPLVTTAKEMASGIMKPLHAAGSIIS